MRKKIAAGNWKMNKTKDEAHALVDALMKVEVPSGTEVILGVPFVYLSELAEKLKESEISLSAQNCHQEASGAYTGEIAANMIASIDVPYVIIGHSERREYFGETNEVLAQKTNAALGQGLKVIFCCGEPLEVREKGNHVDFVKRQLLEGLFHLSASDLDQVIIAYEPIWAIGTGVTASKEQAQEMHKEIRAMVQQKYDQGVADKMHILYGGSVKPDNAKALFSQPDVDGGLVGGASLKADDFAAIILA